MLPPLVPAAAAARRGAGAAAAPRPAALVQRARAVRALLVPLLRGAHRRHAADGRARAQRPGATGLAATEIGDAVHRLLELVDLREPLPPDDLAEPRPRLVPARRRTRSSSGSPGSSRSYCESELARRVAALAGRAAGAPVRVRARRRPPPRPPRRPPARRRPRARRRLQDELARRGHAGGDRRRATTASSASSTRSPASAPAPSEVEVVYHFLERPDAVVTTVFSRRAGSPSSRRSCPRAIARINAGRVPADAERVHLRRLPGARRRLRRPAPAHGGVRRARPRYASRSWLRSYVDEARRRVGPKRARIRPIIERLAGGAPRRARSRSGRARRWSCSSR